MLRPNLLIPFFVPFLFRRNHIKSVICLHTAGEHVSDPDPYHAKNSSEYTIFLMVSQLLG